jgi:hypothetical protein
MSSRPVPLSNLVRLSATHQLTEILHGSILWQITCPVIPLVQTLAQLLSIYSG